MINTLKEKVTLIKDKIDMTTLNVIQDLSKIKGCTLAVFGNNCAIIDSNDDKKVAESSMGWVTKVVIFGIVIAVVVAMIAVYKESTGNLKGQMDQLKNLAK